MAKLNRSRRLGLFRFDWFRKANRLRVKLVDRITGQ